MHNPAERLEKGTEGTARRERLQYLVAVDRAELHRRRNYITNHRVHRPIDMLFAYPALQAAISHGIRFRDNHRGESRLLEINWGQRPLQ